MPSSDPSVDAVALSRTVDAHRPFETPGVQHMERYVADILSGQSFRELLGPVRDGAGASGLCVHRGKVIASWGDPDRIEMSFSVTKTYLSVLTGVAADAQLIDVEEPVSSRISHPAFAGSPSITWAHLLHQTSEWGGSLWGLPWWADPQGGQDQGDPLSSPGTVWAYNDVRVNLLAVALLLVFRRPLAEVLADAVMEPIGASDTWEWHGYRDAHVHIDGQAIPSVSGGAHWGGGLWASAHDHARLGVLYLQGGQWDGRAVLSRDWVDSSWAPCPVKEDYGYLWWRNDLGTVFPSAPRTGRCARGNAGRQLIWVDPARDLVVVSRWTERVDALLGAISDAVPPASR